MAVHDAKNSVNVTKIESPENKVTLKEAIIANLIIGPIALGLYFGIYYGIHIANPIYILNNMYYFPYLLSFCCFFVLPVLYLIIFRIITKKKTRLFISTKKGLEPKNIISGLMQGFAMHAGLFFPWVALVQIYLIEKVDTLSFFLLTPNPDDYFFMIVFIALSVTRTEYYTKAFVQIQFSEAVGSISLFRGKLKISGGKKLGLVASILVWIIGHITEFLWLQDFLGPANAVFYLLISGVLTAYTVWHTENIFGVTIGHILLNILLVTAFPTRW
ncbi:MAG: hypothetical protein ACTSXA_07070 [Candidatus Heimdallarchaeota archaeon]